MQELQGGAAYPVRVKMVCSKECCCQNCFCHPWPKNQLAVQHAGRWAQCYYCGTQAALEPISLLAEGFSNLLGDYMPWDGEQSDPLYPPVPLIEALQRDWHVFSDCFWHSPARGDFIAALLPHISSSRFFLPPECRVLRFHRNAPNTAYGTWLDFWVIDKNYARQALQQLLTDDLATLGTLGKQFSDHLKNFGRRIPAGYELWRARVGFTGDPDLECSALPIDEMGPNPIFPAARLNLARQTIFYCAESERTAVAEVRPARGYLVTTCRLSTKRALNLLDLVEGLGAIDPFSCNQLRWMLDLQRLLRNLAASSARPVNKGDDEDTYLITQGAALVARKMGYDGIRFPSSLHPPEGRNLGLFGTDCVEYLASRLVRIESSSVTFRSFGRVR